MSATLNNAAWGVPSSRQPPAPDQPAGHDALQALLAFAYVHEQARKRRLNSPAATASLSETDALALDEVLKLVAARGLSITGADGLAIALADENAIVCRAAAGRVAPDLGTRLDPNSGFSGACLRMGETVRCDDSDTDSRVNAQACRALGTRSMVAVPLSAKSRVVGLIEAFSSEPFGFNDSDVKSLNLLGELILAAIRPEEEERLAELGRKILPTSAPEKSKASRPALPPEPQPARLPSATNLRSPADLVKAATAKPEPSAKARAEEPVALGVAKSEDKPALSSILVSVALVTVVVALGVALSLRIRQVRRMQHSISANSPPSVTQDQARAELKELPLPTSPAAESASQPLVTGLRHWSSDNSSTVVVDLENPVQYETHTIGDPPRVYFDLYDTKIAPSLLNQSIAVDDAYLKRVRMAQPKEGITRVVLETNGDADVSVKLESNPYRLTIEVRKPAPESHTPAAPKPAPALSPATKNISQGSAAHPAELRIVLDAGHGGWDLGTVGRKGLLEKDLCLDIVERLGKLIAAQLGAQVIYTRQDDTYLPLEKRAEIANLASADLFLSVHANYSELTSARGVETYYSDTYSSIKARTVEDEPKLKSVNWTGVDIREKVTSSHRFAADVQQALYLELAASNREIRNRGVKEAQYVVLTGTQMPAVLAEISFVSSPADEDRLQSSEYRQQIAEALYRGIAKFRDERKRTQLESARN